MHNARLYRKQVRHLPRIRLVFVRGPIELQALSLSRVIILTEIVKKSTKTPKLLTAKQI
jgi:hypothetical protein